MQIERDEARLFYTSMGSGPNVVLIHPTPTNHCFWLPIAELLADRYRLTLVDLRGHGRSGLGSGPVTVEKLAQDVHAVLEQEKIERAAFVGCSVGSYILYEYWRRFPQQMSAIALTCGKPQPDTDANRERRHEWMREARKPGGLGRFFDLMADTLIGPSAAQRDPKKRVAVRAMMGSVALEAMQAIQQGLALRPDAVPMLETITVPVCAIAGGEDQSSTPTEMQLIAERVPTAEFHLLADAGHYAPFEQPERVAEILGQFLDANSDMPQTAHNNRDAQR